MSEFAKIPTNTFNFIQKKAGILVRTFDPKSPTVQDSDIIGATTGGFQFSAVPAFVDMGDDIDNCPKNTKELMEADGWDVSASGTFVSLDKQGIQSVAALTNIDLESPGVIKFVPKSHVDPVDDFRSIWWVGPVGTDGFLAIHMINAINSGGFKLQTEDNGKGKYSFTYTCHPSIESQDQVPFEIYMKEPTSAAQTGE